MKIAIIGCGSIANSQHIPAYMKNQKAEIKYFCDIIKEKAESAVKTYGCGKAITNYMDAIDDPEVKAISICTPNVCHSEIAIAALEHGKDVLCEKPAARTYSEALKMQEAQHKTGRILNIGVVNRFNESVRKIKQIIDAGELGEIYNIYVSFRSHRSIPGLGGAFTRKDMAGGGVLIDWGVHFLDIVMYCCGDPKPITISSEAFCKLGKNIRDYVYTDMWAGPPIYDGIYDVEDFITGLIRTEGPTISFNGAWAQNIGEEEMYIDFIGSKAGIRLKYGADFVKYGTDRGELTTTQYKIKAGDAGSSMFQMEIDAFIEDVETREKLPSHIDINIITAKILDAIYQSAEKHKEITVL